MCAHENKNGHYASFYALSRIFLKCCCPPCRASTTLRTWVWRTPRQVLDRINDVLNHLNAHGARVTGKPEVIQAASRRTEEMKRG